jgi:2-oxoglutarate ferredoxin oxidoreductase subunit alpha
MKPLRDYIMTDGNTAAALGAIFGGVQFVAWYPITPASSLAEGLNEYLPQFRKHPVSGKNTYAVIQAEDELAAIGMTIGAGWAGLRSMTSTSGPGISLMAEYIGLAYYTEVPVVIWNVQRVGPSTGLPTRTAQGDITEVYFLSHGDKDMIMLLPGTVQECFEFGWKAFDIAERFQCPVVVMIDLDFGMNQWMTKKFQYPDTPMDRGKVLWEKDFEAVRHEWGRYLDKDGDGIPYRTILGNLSPGSSYFARGTGHDEYAHYSEEPEIWERVMERLQKKYRMAAEKLPSAVLQKGKDSKIGIISYGSTDPAVVEAIDLLANKGHSYDYLRIRSIPFSKAVRKFICDHDRVFVIECNRDGQMRQLLSLDHPECANKLVKIAHGDGLPLSAKWIVNEILTKEEK